MLYNTGGVTQTFGSLHNMVVTKKAHYEAKEPNANKRGALILQKVSMVSNEPWTRNFGMQHVMMMQDLEKRAPDVVRKSMVVVDGIRESPEVILDKLTACFGNSGMGLPDLGTGE